MSRFNCVAALATAVLSTHVAYAEPTRSFELVWQAPPGCPASSEVEREIERLIGDASRNRATVRAAAEITHSGDDWRVRIRIQEGEHASERSFEGASCRAVTKVASLIIALAIEPNAGTPPETAPPAAPVKPEPAPPPTVRRTAEPVENTLRGFLVAGPLAELRLLPGVGLGFEIGVGARLGAISGDWRVSALLPERIDAPSRETGGRFFLASTGARLCARIASRAPEIFGCAAGSLDILHAEGYGVTSPGSATALLGAASLGPRLDFPLGNALRLSLAVEGAYTFSEASFRLDNVGNVHRTPRWGGSARAQVVWLF